MPIKVSLPITISSEQLQDRGPLSAWPRCSCCNVVRHDGLVDYDDPFLNDTSLPNDNWAMPGCDLDEWMHEGSCGDRG